MAKNITRQFSLCVACTYLHVISLFPEISEMTVSVSHLNVFFDFNHSECLLFVAFIAYYFPTSFISPHCFEIYSILNFTFCSLQEWNAIRVTYHIEKWKQTQKDTRILFVCNLFSLLNQLTILKLFKWLKRNLNKLWTFLNRYAI